MSNHASHSSQHWTDASEHHGFHPHVTPLWVYFAVYAALLVLTVATVGLYRLDPGHHLVSIGFSPNLAHPINMVLSMIIATIKASLVAMIFMHLWWDNKYYLLLFLGSIIFLAVFMIVTLFDTERRGDIYAEQAIPTELRADFYHDKNVHPEIFTPHAGGEHGEAAEHGEGAAAEHGTATEHGEAAAEHSAEAVPAASSAAAH